MWREVDHDLPMRFRASTWVCEKNNEDVTWREMLDLVCGSAVSGSVFLRKE
jgi:hypothetical protein